MPDTLLADPPFQNFGEYPRDRMIRDLRDFYEVAQKLQARIVELETQVADHETRIVALEP